MDAYVVSWGLAKGDDRIELDAIAHTDRSAAQKEYDLVDLSSVIKGKMSRLRNEGWEAYCTLSQVAMLDAAEKPTSKVSDWTFDGERALLDEKLA